MSPSICCMLAATSASGNHVERVHLNRRLVLVSSLLAFQFFLMEGDMQCRHVTPVISIHRNQIPLRCHRNPRITMDCLIFCMQCRHAIPLANQNRVCSVAMWMAQQVICSVAMRPGLPTVHSMQCRPPPFHSYAYMQCRRLTCRNALPICIVASSHVYSMMFKGGPQSLNHRSL